MSRRYQVVGCIRGTRFRRPPLLVRPAFVMALDDGRLGFSLFEFTDCTVERTRRGIEDVGSRIGGKLEPLQSFARILRIRLSASQVDGARFASIRPGCFVGEATLDFVGEPLLTPLRAQQLFLGFFPGVLRISYGVGTGVNALLAYFLQRIEGVPAGHARKLS